MSTVVIKNISKIYDANHYLVKAVDEVDLSIGENETVAIVGPSGSGKSTLLNMIGLILQPSDGQIIIDGQNTGKLSDGEKSALRNKTFGYIMQDFALLDDESVYKNIELPLIYNRDIKRSEHKKRITAAAEKLGISDKLRRKAGRLSGGERQRVAIARAIVCDQPIILADELTGSLDSENKENVMKILLELCRNEKRTLVVVTHDMTVAEQCGRIIQMRSGGMNEFDFKDFGHSY